MSAAATRDLDPCRVLRWWVRFHDGREPEPRRPLGADGVGHENALAAVVNTTALLAFFFSPSLVWLAAIVLRVGAVAGGLVGAWRFKRLPERNVRIVVVLTGVALTVGLFLRR